MARKKDLDVEVDLVAFISLLSVCICFLLLTVILVNVGSMEVKQAVGGQAAEDSVKVPAMWADMKTDGSVILRLRDAPKIKRSLRSARLKGVDGEIDYAALEKHVMAVKAAVPALNTVLIQPKANTVYEQVITLMDFFKGKELTDLGVSPLGN